MSSISSAIQWIFLSRKYLAWPGWSWIVHKLYRCAIDWKRDLADGVRPPKRLASLRQSGFVGGFWPQGIARSCWPPRSPMLWSCYCAWTGAANLEGIRKKTSSRKGFLKLRSSTSKIFKAKKPTVHPAINEAFHEHFHGLPVLLGRQMIGSVTDPPWRRTPCWPFHKLKIWIVS